MADNNKRQAYIPEGALPLPNPVGTAPCFLSEDVRGRGFIVSLPGVPRELEYMMTNTVIPLLVERMGGAKTIKARVLRTCAVGESDIDRAIGDLMTLANPTVGLAAHSGQTDIRITAKADTEAEAEAMIEPIEADVRKRLGIAIYGVDQETVPEVVGRLLADRGLKLAVIDTLTEGQVVRELVEAGFGYLIAAIYRLLACLKLYMPPAWRPRLTIARYGWFYPGDGPGSGCYACRWSGSCYAWPIEGRHRR